MLSYELTLSLPDFSVFSMVSFGECACVHVCVCVCILLPRFASVLCPTGLMALGTGLCPVLCLLLSYSAQCPISHEEEPSTFVGLTHYTSVHEASFMLFLHNSSKTENEKQGDAGLSNGFGESFAAHKVISVGEANVAVISLPAAL